MLKGLWVLLKTVAGVASLVAVLLLAVVLWFFAPVLLGLQSWWAVLLVALVPPLLWLGVVLFLVRRSLLRDAALVAGATQEDEKSARERAANEAAKEEHSAVAGRLSEALKAMKAAGAGGGAYLYERPWYVLIGPPGSGKTTAIRNSGLKFPLAEGRVSGVGGTRNCDWWIAEQAVLIDTAGRYTTQDSDAQADKAGWERFLDLLRRERPQQPLNGVVVAFGADMLTRLDAAGREQHAQAVRKRVRELEQRLGQRLPVYFLISKADLVVGFTEFFDDLDREARHQVWGMSFPPEATPEGPVAGFRAEFQALLQRLQDRLFERLQAERGAEQRAAIAGFPGQFASLEEPVAAFMQAAFGGSKLDPAPYLRGLYFTSGTQEGTPIDRLTGALSRAFALDARRPAALSPAKGRSYFLGRLLLDVVFNEARLAARDQGVERRQRRLQWATLGLAAVVLVAGLAWGWHAASLEGERAERMAGAAQAAEQSAQQVSTTLPLDRASPRDDLTAALPLLQASRALPPAAQGDAGGLGLGQQDKLSGAGDLAYQHALERVLLPRMMSRLEGQIREQMQQPQFLYLATRVYLMLGRQGPMDRALIQEWMDADWTQAYPGSVNAPVRSQLAEHLGALLQQDFATYALDGALVDAARRVFSRLPMDERIYARLRSTATAVAPWRPADALGLSGQRLFVLNNGQALSEAAVPGLFTVEGLHSSLLPRLPQAIEEAAAEAWVLGPEGAALAANAELLEGAVLRRYAQDYADEWQKLLDSLELAPLGTPAQAADALNLLAAPNSPLRDLLLSVARELDVATPPPSVSASAAAAASAVAVAGTPGVKAPAALVRPLAGASRVAQAMGVEPSADPLKVVADTVNARLGPLREAAGPPLDRVLVLLNELYAQVARVASQAPGSAPLAPAAGLDAGQRLLGEAQRAPEPLAGWLRALAQSSSSAQAGGARAAVAAAAGQQLAPFCRGVESRFPFNASVGAVDMPMADFQRLFGQGGALEQFFDQNLREFVDTSGPVWRPVSVAGGPSPISAGDVAQFQRASQIRNAFFAAGGAAIRVDMVPLGGTGAVLDVAGARTKAADGLAARTVSMQWPNAGPVSLAFDGEPVANAWVYDSPWAALRLVSRGQLQRTAAPDRLRVSFQLGAKTAQFELRTSSIVHPFGLRALAEFRCPQLAP